jgi:hypothetical protein
MNVDPSTNDPAGIEEALRRMKANGPGIPGERVQAFLTRLQAELDRGATLTDEQIREKFQRFVAEAPHVPS